MRNASNFIPYMEFFMDNTSNSFRDGPSIKGICTGFIRMSREHLEIQLKTQLSYCKVLKLTPVTALLVQFLCSLLIRTTFLAFQFWRVWSNIYQISLMLALPSLENILLTWMMLSTVMVLWCSLVHPCWKLRKNKRVQVRPHVERPQERQFHWVFPLYQGWCCPKWNSLGTIVHICIVQMYFFHFGKGPSTKRWFHYPVQCNQVCWYGASAHSFTRFVMGYMHLNWWLQHPNCNAEWALGPNHPQHAADLLDEDKSSLLGSPRFGATNSPCQFFIWRCHKRCTQWAE